MAPNTPMDTFEYDHAYEILVDLPGIETKDIHISVSHHTMNISALRCNKDTDQRIPLNQERYYGEVTK